MRRAAILALAAVAITGCGTSTGPRARPAGAPLTENVHPEISASARAVDLRRALPLVTGVSARALGYRVVLAPRIDPGLRALTDTVAHTITLYMAQGDAAHRVAHDLAHELGHAWDAEHMTPATRHAYLAGRGVPRATWWPTQPGRSDYGVGAGDFAEVFALCHAASPDYRSHLAPRPIDPCAVLPQGAR